MKTTDASNWPMLEEARLRAAAVQLAEAVVGQGVRRGIHEPSFLGVHEVVRRCARRDERRRAGFLVLVRVWAALLVAVEGTSLLTLRPEEIACNCNSIIGE